MDPADRGPCPEAQGVLAVRKRARPLIFLRIQPNWLRWFRFGVPQVDDRTVRPRLTADRRAIFCRPIK